MEFPYRVALRRQDRQFESGHPDKKPHICGVFLFMGYTVYVLYSSSCRKFYSGQTQDLENRLIEHNSGETKSIKSCIPWSLIWKLELPTRVEAMKLEKKIKSRGAERFLADNGISIS